MTPVMLETTRGPIEYVSIGDGPPVLALHGAMGGWDQSSVLARAIVGPTFLSLAVSRPGYLGTPVTSGQTPDEQADLYAAMLDALRIDRVALVAISGGGMSAVRFALRHPGRCAALVLVSTVGSPQVQGPPALFHVLGWLARVPWVAQRLERPRDPGSSARRAIPDDEQRARALADPVTGPLLREMLASTRRRMADRLPGTRMDITAARWQPPPFEHVSAPTLVVHGTADTTVPFDRHGAVLAQRIPQAELLSLEGGGHFAVFTHRSAIADRVRAFLTPGMASEGRAVEPMAPRPSSS